MNNNEPLRQKRAAADSGAVAEGANSLGEFHLLAVGIDQYEDTKWSLLNSPLNDVAAICAVLELRYGFERKNIEVIPSKAATKNEIFSKLLEYSSAENVNENVEKVLSEDDSLMIWLAGHGREHKGTGRSFFIPRNGPTEFCPQTWLDYGLFGDVLKGIKARHILLVSDSCFAAGIFNDRGKPDENITSPEYAKYHMQYKSRRAITSGAYIDTVSDDGVDGYSIFTHTALEVLRTNKRTHLSSKGFCGLIENTIDEAFCQYPREGELRSVIRNGGQFAFILKECSGDFEASKQHYLKVARGENYLNSEHFSTSKIEMATNHSLDSEGREPLRLVPTKQKHILGKDYAHIYMGPTSQGSQMDPFLEFSCFAIPMNDHDCEFGFTDLHIDIEFNGSETIRLDGLLGQPSSVFKTDEIKVLARNPLSPQLVVSLLDNKKSVIFDGTYVLNEKMGSILEAKEGDRIKQKSSRVLLINKKGQK